ncbi:MAG TPA: class C beta-lactamase-related serine hydrolase, partial [Candidatus Hydrogenedentes bacterium]|nr:class C beta-lactamase-related serine hydrolase [Candidatus Hydrogenedentota bacterium]
YAMDMPLLNQPDTTWVYSSGNTVMLSLILRQAYGDDAYYRLPHKELFGKIGMNNTILEADPSGTLVGGAFVYATARDYARFGLLYLHGGVWQGERILPRGWVKYGRTATARKKYGAHWWLPSAGARNEAKDRGRPLPNDMFFAWGFEGQAIVVIPSRDLVVVRLGLAYFRNIPPFDYVSDILAAIPE